VRSALPQRVEGASVIALSAAAAAGPLLWVLVVLARSFGHNIPAENIFADYLLGVIAAGVLGVSVLLWPLADRERRACLILWGFKVVTCLLVMLPYEGYYDFLDAYAFFRESLDPSKPISLLSLALGTDTIVFLFSKFWVISPPSYHLAKVFCAYAGLVSVVLFYKTLQRLTGSQGLASLYVIGLFPSILFWSSIAGKDPIILMGIAITLFFGIAWLQKPGLKQLLGFLLGIVVASAIRPWIGALLLATFLFAALLRQLQQLKWRSAVYAVPLVVAAGAILGIGMLGSSVLGTLLIELERLSNSWAIGGSAVNAPVQLSSWQDVLAFLPYGAFTALFRPLPGEVMNVFGLSAGLENLLLLVLCGLALFCMRRAHLARPEIVWLGSFLIAWSMLYAFLSYQNLGTATRFKAQVLPVMLVLIGYLAHHRLRSAFRQLVDGLAHRLQRADPSESAYR
jgi:hypothetical protein